MRELIAFKELLLVNMRLFLRKKAAVFYTFIFPIFLLVFFGSVWGKTWQGYVVFLVPGLIGMVALSNAFFGLGVPLTNMRYYGMLRRFRVTPLSGALILAAQMTNLYLIILAQSACTLWLAKLIFNVPAPASIIGFFAVLTLGIFAFMAMGTLISILAKSPEGATGLANLLFLPMLFLSGSFFPIGLFPKVFQYVSEALPLTQLLSALRGVYHDANAMRESTVSLLVLTGWLMVCFSLGAKKFRWD